MYMYIRNVSRNPKKKVIVNHHPINRVDGAQWLFRCYSDRDMIKYQCIKNKYRIHNIIYQFSQQLKDIMGSKLTKVIVYGSYARGDYNSSSDVDVMILVKMSDNEIKK